MSDTNPPPFTESDLPSYDGAPPELALSVTVGEKGGDVLVSLLPPREPTAATKKANTHRAPVDIVCVIDVSGSMDSAATMPDEDGKQTETQLSILDVVRHAMRTIKANLQPDDRLAIVTFHDNAQIVAPLTFMTEPEKALMDTRIDALKPLSSTNLWDGLKQAMDLLNGKAAADEFTPVAPRRTSGQSQHTRNPSFLKKVFGSSGKTQSPAVASSSTEKIEPSSAVPSPSPSHSNRVASIMLLTDGQPNVSPPQGELKALVDYLDANPSNFTISTFGFGYNLDSQLLSKLSAAGGGQFAFIPDSGMVGTVFVHAVANVMATYSAASTVSVEIPDGAKDAEVHSTLRHVKTSWGFQVELGDLMYGQSREFVVRLPSGSSTAGISATATFSPWNAESASAMKVSAAVRPISDSADRADIKYHGFRQELAAVLLEAASTTTPSSRSTARAKASAIDAQRQGHVDKLRNIASCIRLDEDLAGHANALALVDDIEGQVLLALESNEYFNKWGKHYIPSLAQAHQRQKCVNFKDAGQLVYGADSPIFVKERDALDAAFDKIPAPKPTRQTYGGHSGRAVSSMAGMNSRYGPCVHGASVVRLASGAAIRVDELRREMRVQTAAGPREVVAVVESPMPSGAAQLCTLPGGLRVTPWHPVRLAGTAEWVFPADIVQPEFVECTAVYSVLLARADGSDDAHALIMDGEVAVIGLGHGVAQGILEHEFFGNFNAVVSSLAALEETRHGVFVCGGVRRGVDGRVNAFVAEDHPAGSSVIGHAHRAVTVTV